MLLPTKYIPENNTLLAVGAILLEYLTSPMTLSSLWTKARNEAIIGSFERFIIALDFLYILGVVEIHNSLLTKVRK